MENMSGKHSQHARAERNGRWNKGTLMSSHGYILVRVPKNHRRAFGGENNLNHAYAYQHDLVMEKKMGRQLTDGEEVHHDNEIKTDNRPSNLILKSKPEHMKHHDQLRGRDGLGRFPRKDLRVRQFPKGLQP